MHEDEKTPWWMWPLLPIWLLVQLASFLFVIAFSIWRILLYLSVPIVVIGVALVLITGGTDDNGPTSHAYTAGEAQTIGLYCIYGAVSEAQYEGCLEHVGVQQIERLNTNAALYAKGLRSACGQDAGPGCAPRDVILKRIEDARP